MTEYRTPKFLRLIPVAALLATTLAAAAPAQASPDPEPTPAAAPMKKDIRLLNRTARGLVWCVERKVADTSRKTKQCKTRETWIREGADPFGEY